MKLYKLTDQLGQTKNHTQWGENVTHTTNGNGPLCSEGWLHAYEHPLLAVLLNPIHANFPNPRLWEAEGSGEVLRDGQLKLGVTRLTTVREISLPVVTIEQLVRFAILCAKQVCSDPDWNTWADRWMSGEDRSCSEAAAATAATAAATAARAAARAEAWAWAAAEAWAAAAAEAWAAAAAAAAEDSVRANPTLNLIAIVEEACSP